MLSRYKAVTFYIGPLQRTCGLGCKTKSTRPMSTRGPGRPKKIMMVPANELHIDAITGASVMTVDGVCMRNTGTRVARVTRRKTPRVRTQARRMRMSK